MIRAVCLMVTAVMAFVLLAFGIDLDQVR